MSYCNQIQHCTVRIVLASKDTLLILKKIPYFDSITIVYILGHIQYHAVTLGALLTVIQYKYSNTGCLSWGRWMPDTTSGHTDDINVSNSAFLYIEACRVDTDLIFVKITAFYKYSVPFFLLDMHAIYNRSYLPTLKNIPTYWYLYFVFSLQFWSSFNQIESLQTFQVVFKSIHNFLVFSAQHSFWVHLNCAFCPLTAFRQFFAQMFPTLLSRKLFSYLCRLKILQFT